MSEINLLNSGILSSLNTLYIPERLRDFLCKKKLLRSLQTTACMQSNHGSLEFWIWHKLPIRYPNVVQCTTSNTFIGICPTQRVHIQIYSNLASKLRFKSKLNFGFDKQNALLEVLVNLASFRGPLRGFFCSATLLAFEKVQTVRCDQYIRGENSEKWAKMASKTLIREGINYSAVQSLYYKVKRQVERDSWKPLFDSKTLKRFQ